MRQTLILHIGTHKTGSTSIQNYLYYNRLWLRHLGVFYPRPINGRYFYTNNHNDLRDTALSEGKHRSPHIHPEFGSHDALLGRYIRTIKEVGRPVNILSSEGWSSHLNRYARRLAPLTQHFDVKVVTFMRRPDHWIEKFYAQRIANIEHAETRTFDAFVAQPHIETYLYNRHRMFNWWAKAFAPNALSVIPYEPASPGFDLIGRFLDVCAVDAKVARNLVLRHANANPTLPPSQAEKLRSLIEKGEPVDQRRVRAMKRAPDPGTHRYLSDEARTQILGRARPDMDAICADFVRDGRSELFPGQPETLKTLVKSD